MSEKIHPLVLIILDGWGYREEHKDNAIAQANKPHWDQYWDQYPHTLIFWVRPVRWFTGWAKWETPKWVISIWVRGALCIKT